MDGGRSREGRGAAGAAGSLLPTLAAGLPPAAGRAAPAAALGAAGFFSGAAGLGELTDSSCLCKKKHKT